jgi:PAS domain S-box-containing protein
MGEWQKYREKIIGLGEKSARKSYYPELQEKIEELEESQTNLQTILNSTSDSIVIHNKDGVFLFLNHQARKLYNISEEEISHYSIYDISSPDNNLILLHEIWEDVLQGIPRVIEWIVKPIQTEVEIPVQVSINLMTWYGDLALVAVVRDFSERKKYENELIIARKKAEESDRLKSVFLANLSHEIRTPMNAILGFSGFLKDNTLPEETRHNFIDIIHTSGNQLLSIINDIIEISKIETNQITPNFAPVQIDTLLDDIYQIFQIISLENNVELKIKTNISPNLTILTDDTKLRQVITNLLTNAFKFTKEGFVEIGCSEKGGQIEFYVKDTGIGIDRKFFKVIFERFRQIENDLSIQKGGSGLGLAISKAYVEMMGGTISVDSKENVGSIFTFTLPNNKPLEKIRPVFQGNDEHVLKEKDALILIAEDDDLNFMFLEEMLSQNKFKILRAYNGKDAVDKVALDSGIDLVLMDIKMPVMNGYEAFDIIKHKHPGIPVIAQTAYALEEDHDRILKAGFNGYITKPIKREMLFKLINQLI